ncbi:MAG: aminotransferase class I/II-fold pyridoxal phosphate-dependent enzyme [Woeseiaceae bacterium]|nr:aminotransferase class I/II-fold pyridoxal phosphate-dependent enzyme [Woeseiaceae bacterium]
MFDVLLKTVDEEPEAVIGFSLSRSPKLGEFLDELDPNLSLDWNNRSFQGLPELREHVVRQAGLGENLSSDDVLITAGAAEANYLAIRQLVGADDEIVSETPGWPQVAVLANAIGARLVEVQRRDDAGWDFPMQELASSVTERTRLIFLSNPNNPTGRLLSEDELQEIVALARPHGTYVLVDEVYAGLEWSGARRPSIAGLYERGITTGSVSKALGLQGLRIGWMVSPDNEVIRDALILRENSSEIMNILGEAVAEIALRPERYASAMGAARAEGLANLGLLDAFIDSEPRLSWIRPEAGLIGLAHLEDGIDGDTLGQRLLAEPYKTFIVPGSAYGLPAHIRVGVGGGPEVNLEDGLRRLSACLRDMDTSR